MKKSELKKLIVEVIEEENDPLSICKSALEEISEMHVESHEDAQDMKFIAKNALNRINNNLQESLSEEEMTLLEIKKLAQQLLSTGLTRQQTTLVNKIIYMVDAS